MLFAIFEPVKPLLAEGKGIKYSLTQAVWKIMLLK